MSTQTANEIDQEKYVQVLEYLLRLEDDGGANNDRLGKVKLMKLLYFADFEHFYRHGKSITGDVYIKRRFGPVPKTAGEILKRMVAQKCLTISRQRMIDYHRNVYQLQEVSKRFDRLSVEERNTLDSIIHQWKRNSMQDVILASHGDPPWKLVDYDEEIPYELVYYRQDLENESDEDPVSDDVTQGRRAS